MTEYRITKYDPSFRNVNGHYLLDDWTDRSGVGKIYNGKLLTKTEYIKVEKAYINAITKILTHSNLDHFRIVGLENKHFTKSLQEAAGLWYYEKDFELAVLHEDTIVSKMNWN